MEDHTSPNSETIKLIINNALLESEARTAAKIDETITQQNKVYMTEIVSITKSVAALQTKVEAQGESLKGFKAMTGWLVSASLALGGIVGFFVNQLSSGAK